jgi:catechol 2,3-dioxygenase-like lactoylglutathione lyase family enzyme
MEILSSRVILRPRDHARSLAFYRDTLGLAVYREFPGGTVFYAGNGLLEVSGHGGEENGNAGHGVVLWLQVRDIAVTARELERRNVPIVREAKKEPWGLLEMWIADPEGLRIVLVEIPSEHPLRKDQRN